MVSARTRSSGNGKAPALTVVIATFNRLPQLSTLLEGLGQQSLDPHLFEAVVVDDGSRTPVSRELRRRPTPYALRVLRQRNQGPAAARDRGIRAARGDIVVIVDDDMELPPDFLQQHLQAHQRGADVVLGQILPSPELASMPLFERFHAQQLARFVHAVTRKGTPVRGVHLCTGNVSFRRELYLDVGGFDPSLPRSEDREIGIRFEKAGAALTFAEGAASVHRSDHTDLGVWLRRAYDYGFSDARISRKHQELENADPWRFFFLVSPLSRPLLLAVVAAPGLAQPLATAMMRVAGTIDAVGLLRPALAATTLAYGVEYFSGLRGEATTVGRALGGLMAYQRKRAMDPRSGGAKSRGAAVWRFVDAVRGDYAAVQRHRAKYHHEAIPGWRFPLHLVQKIGLQLATTVRVMQLLRDARVPLAPQVCSRLIRHLYGAEIHWDADIAPGISIVHGNGLVISHAAKVSSGCILFHNVTLGEGIDPSTRQVGGPTLEQDVHVGPGVSIIGPVTVGRGTKIAAGAVLTRSVPANSLVEAGAAKVSARSGKPATPAGARGVARARD